MSDHYLRMIYFVTESMSMNLDVANRLSLFDFLQGMSFPTFPM